MKRSHILYGKKLPPLLILLLLVLTLLNALSLNMVGVSAGEYPAIYIDPANTTDPTLTPGSNYTISIKTDYIGERVNDTWAGDGANTTFVTTLKPVVENSEEVYVNGALMTRDVDYTINYSTGNVTFTTAPASGVEVKAIYTHGDIWGWSFSLTYDPRVLHGGVKKTDTWIAGTKTTDTWIGDNVTKSFITTEKPVVPDSEKVYVDLTLMTKPENYTIKYSTGNITFTTAPGAGANVTAIYLPLSFSTTGTPVVEDSEEVYVNQTLMTRITERTDVWIGDGVTRTFITTQPVFPDSETVLVDRRHPSWWGLDYTVGYSPGNVTFDPAPEMGAEIKVIYNNWGDYTINYEEGTITFPTNLEYEIFPPPDGVEIKATYLYGGVTNGDLITKNIHKSAQFIPGTFNNTIGKLSIPNAFFGSTIMPQPVTSGPGTLANVTFTVVGKGISNITLGPDTALEGWTEGGSGEWYRIIDVKTMPEHIQHGSFDNRFQHDVAVVSVTAPTKAVVGELVPISVEVANIGKSSEAVEVAVSYDGVPIETKQVTLLVGESKAALFSWNTTGAAQGTYTINATATVSEDGDLDDNWNTPTILLVEHDVAVGSVTAPYKAAVGKPVSISVEVANLGAHEEMANVTIRYDSTYIDSQNVTLLMGESETVSFSWNTTGVEEDKYTINATATIEDDGDLTNNWNTPTILLVAHDVAIISLDAPAEAFVGYPVFINVTVTNIGSSDENVTLTVSYLEKRPIGDLLIDTATENFTLNKGLSQTVPFNWDTTGLATIYPYLITAKATVLKSIENPEGIDEDLTDNTKTKQIELTLAHDVDIISFSVTPYKVFVGERVNIILIVKNVGEYNETLKVEVSYDTNIIREFQQIKLLPENLTTLSSTWNTTDVAPGSYTIKAEAILAEGIEDANPDNNLKTQNIVVKSPLGTIVGNVTDAYTGKPISEATVTAGDYTNTTNADGYYIISGVQPGNYTVTASATGYESDSKSATVDAGETTTVNFTLRVIINITISADPETITVGESTTLSVSISPSLEGLNITIQYKLSDEETWTNLTTVITDENGQRSHDWTPETAETYEVKAIWLGDESVSPAESDVQPITAEEASTPGTPWYLYMAAAAVVAIVMVAIAFYFLRIRKPT